MQTTFWLNNTLVSTDESPGMLLLDFVRKNALKGTKEGCKEGDCGACTLLVGDLKDGKLHYDAITSCLMPLGDAHAKHILTVEGLSLKDNLSPVQSAMVKFGGSQCGYCTPGFIMAMSSFFMSEEEPSMDTFKRAISGNLCRCTGYASILRAGEEIIALLKENDKLEQAIERIPALIDLEFLPPYLENMAAKVASIDAQPPTSNTDIFIAGGTDLYVQQGEKIPSLKVEILNRIPELKGFRIEDDNLIVGALTDFEAFGRISHVRKLIPNIDNFLQLIASLPIRNRATLGGNIVNASPIGDMTQILLALNSTLTLTLDGQNRDLAMADFFIDYKKTDLKKGEILKEIRFWLGDDKTRVNFEKVSKRKELDIATVCSGARFELDDTHTIGKAYISLGGVFATPLLLTKTNAFLAGKTICTQTIQESAEILQSEISPISDVRGSKNYKRLLARQLYFAHFTSLFPDIIHFKELLAS